MDTVEFSLPGMFVRAENNPVLHPDSRQPWRSRKVYNPAALLEDGKYHLFFRAVGEDWISSVGYATSADGEIFSTEDTPRLAPVGAAENRGIEDPRLVKIDGTYYLTYTAYDGDCARLSLATSTDLKDWQRRGTMLEGWNFYEAGGFVVDWDEARRDPDRRKGEWSKAGGMFSEKINGQYLMLFGDSAIWFAASADGLAWRAENKPFIEKRAGFFDSVHLEMGPPPLKTAAGWLVLYHGIDSSATYRLGYLLFDLNDPRKILKRSRRPIFEPQAPYELSGLADISPGGAERLRGLAAPTLDKSAKIADNNYASPRVVFCCGACLDGGVLRIYYGAGDTCVSTASARLADVLKSE